MTKGSKPLLVLLRREDRGINDDPQFSSYYPSYRWVVFHDYGHSTELGSNIFRTKSQAEVWIAGPTGPKWNYRFKK